MTQNKPVHPYQFLKLLKWIDGQPLWPLIDPYRRAIFEQALFTVRDDGAPQYRRILTGRAKKNCKTLDAILASLYKCLIWPSAGQKGNQVYYVASDMGQANDDLDLTKKLVRVNPLLERELTIKANIVERKDGKGFIEILPAGDTSGMHGKSYLFLVLDEFHTQKDYRVLEALELDRTRPDSQQWFASYASLYRHAGVPLIDLLKAHDAQKDDRLYVSWYAGSLDEANPSLGQPLGPTREDLEHAQVSLPSWIFRRLYLNLPGQPDGAAFDADAIERCVVPNVTHRPPVEGIPYRAFVDMSGGGADDSTLCIGHEEDGLIILDLLINQGSRTGKTFNPADTVKGFAQRLTEYGCCAVVGDRYAGQWPRLAFAKEGIGYQVSDLTRAQLYAHLEPLVNAGKVELLDQPKLLQQLIGLIRKGEKIDHDASAHDDWANSAAGVCSLFRRITAEFITHEPEAINEEEEAEELRKRITDEIKQEGWYVPI